MPVRSRAQRRERRNIDGDWKHDRFDGKKTEVPTSKPINKRMWLRSNRFNNSDLFHSDVYIHCHI